MKALIGLIVLVCATCLSDAATQFELSFVQSTNKVIVTDYYYMLEYSIVRGRNRNRFCGRCKKNQNVLSGTF